MNVLVALRARVLAVVLTVVALGVGLVAAPTAAWAANRTVSGVVFGNEIGCCYTSGPVVVDAFAVGGSTTVPVSTSTVPIYQGSYALDLPEGQYRFRYSSPTDADAKYVTRWYGSGGQTVTTATKVSVSGGNVSLGDVEMTAYGRLYGDVNDSETYYPETSQTVEVFKASSSTVPVATQRLSLPDGDNYLYGRNFDFNLPPGDYKVRVRPDNKPGRTGHLDTWSGGAASFAEAATITVDTHNYTYAGDVTLRRWASVTGRVIDDVATSGQPIFTPVEVQLYSASKAETAGPLNFQRDVRNYANNGLFSVSAPPGSYKVKVVPAADSPAPIKPKWLGGTTFANATAVTVSAAGDTAVGDIAVTPTYRLYGYLAEDDPYGQPVANATVKVYKFNSLTTPVATTTTDSGGRWVVPINTAGTYRVQYAAAGYAGEWYEDKTTGSSATNVVVGMPQAGSYCNGGATAYYFGCNDVELNGGSRGGASSLRPSDLQAVTGIVRGPDGAPVTGASIYLEQRDGLWSTQATTTDATGRYSVEARSGYDYLLQVSPYDGSLAPEWYLNARTRQTATPITVGSANVVADVDLDARRSLTGTVGMPGPTAGVLVSAVDVTTGAGVRDQWVYADGGDFNLDGLEPGRYYLRFGSSEFAQVFADGSASGTQRPDDARIFDLRDPTSTVGPVNIALVTAGSVQASDQSYLSQVELVDPDDEQTVLYDSVDCNNYYNACRGENGTVKALRPGVYKVRMNGSEWAGGATFATAPTYQVRPAEVTVLPAPGQYSVIYGTTTTVTGRDASDISVLAYKPGDRTAQAHTRTDGAGNWSLNLPLGDYQLRFSDPAGVFATSWFHETMSRGASQVVSVRRDARGNSANLYLGREQLRRSVLNTSVPSVTGDAVVGKTLTATTGTWSPSTSTVALQWLRDGAPIAGATATTYKVTTTDVGKRLSVAATASKENYASATERSIETTPVAPGALTAPTPTITGTPKVGVALEAKPGTWGPAPVTLSYAWYRGGKTDPVGTGVTYTPTAEDQGAAMTVRVSGAKSGYTTATKTSAVTASVAAGTLTAGDPIVLGAATFGSRLVASPGTWGPGTVDLGYQWLRDGAVIDGATASSYLTDTVDLGKTLTVQVSGAKAGYDGASRTSAAVGPVVERSDLVAGDPTIAGTAKVGSILTASPGTWGPGAVDLSYQWSNRSGPIDGATTKRYTAVAADVGSPLTVAVTGTKTGYTSVTRTSAATAAVAAGTLTSPTPSVSGTAQVGSTLTASTGTWGPEPVSLSVAWYRSGVTSPVGAGSTYAPSAADVGSTLTVKVTGTKTGYTSVTKTSAATAAVIAGTLTPGTVSVSGTPVFNSRLTASAGTWGPGGVDLAYQWLRDGVSIDGATAAAYLTDADDIGHTIAVAVTGTRSGFETVSRTSSALGPIAERGDLTSAQPTVSGTPKVGSPLTATAGTWRPGAVDLAYQWSNASGPIEDATLRRYVPTAADLGSPLTVAVTGSKVGYTSSTRTSTATLPVEPGTFTATPTPTMTGSPNVGKKLVAQAGAWTPGPVTLDYQWLRAGQPIEDADTRSYILQPEDVGSVISVRVTGSRDGYTSEVRTSTATAAVTYLFTSTPVPTITGSVQVGQVVAADTTGWAPEPTAYAFQWLSDGVAISGATQRTYTVAAGLRGKTLSVRATGIKADYTTATVTSAGAVVQPGTFTTAPDPTISGLAKVGQTLTAVPGTWSPTATFTYQWFRDGVAVSGKTASTYPLTSTDVGKVMTVRVTGARGGYTTLQRISAGTSPVSP